MAEIREILRSYLKTGALKETARTLRCAKGTVKRYVRWALAKGYLDGGDLPSEELLFREWRADDKGRAVVKNSLEIHREQIQAWIDDKIILTRMHEMLKERHGWQGSYGSLKRFTLPMRQELKSCVRLEVAPGTEAQVDFGHMGSLWDPVTKRRRKAWLFLMTLSHSRHAYGEFVFTQDVETWIGCHIRAFEFFGGVPGKIVLDNLKAAIIKACVYDPLINRTYRELAEHYNFLISPCIPGTPEHKGKVERGIPYVRKSFFAGRDFTGLQDGNQQLINWLTSIAGMRVHGTTRQQPLVVFEQVEKKHLLPLPEKRYIMTKWCEAKVHRDCHITVAGSYYSVPYKLRGKKMMVCLSESMVRIFYEHKLVANHLGAPKPGTRRTIPGHYPPEKQAYLEFTPQACLSQAKEIGPATHRLIEIIFSRQHPCDGLRRAQGILGFKKKYTAERVEAASKRALYYSLYTYQAIKNILEKRLEIEPLPEETREPSQSLKNKYAFARPIEEFTQTETLSHQEVLLWN